MGTRSGRSRIKILVLGTDIACGLALLVATMGAAAGTLCFEEPGQAADAASASQTYDGMITETRCGAKHKPSIAKSAADCVRVCVHGGAQFALVEGDNSYILEGDRALLKGIAGQRARVVGTLNGKTITVSSVAPRSKEE